jgi:hypothetical protein
MKLNFTAINKEVSEFSSIHFVNIGSVNLSTSSQFTFCRLMQFVTLRSHQQFKRFRLLECQPDGF